MKAGRDIKEIATQLAWINDNGVDFLEPQGAMSMFGGGSEEVSETLCGDVMKVHVGRSQDISTTGKFFRLGEVAHAQLSQSLQIPKPYYDRMKTENPQLLTWNVNEWLRKDPERKKFIRTLNDPRAINDPQNSQWIHGDHIRAILSDSYRPLDNYDLMGAIMPVLEEQDLEIKSCELTTTRLYIKAIMERRLSEVEVGDIISIGVCIQNSDVGMGALRIEPLIERLSCKNGMRVNIADAGEKRVHRGSRLSSVQDIGACQAYKSNETRRAEDHAFWLNIRDGVKSCTDNAILSDVAHAFRMAKGIEIRGNTLDVVTDVGRKVDLGVQEIEGVMEHLMKSNDLSQYGLANAVTRYSQDVESYDRATELEGKGWNVMTMSSVNFSSN